MSMKNTQLTLIDEQDKIVQKRSISHNERRLRAAQIVEDGKRLYAQNYLAKDVTEMLAIKYELVPETIGSILRKFNVYKPKSSRAKIYATKIAQENDDKQKIADALRNSCKTYVQIAEEFGYTKQYIQLIHKKLLDDGHDVPTREEVRERKRLAKEQDLIAKDNVFIDKFIATNDFVASASFAGISLSRARSVRRSYRLNGTGLIVDQNISKELPTQRISGRWLYIVADFFKAEMSLTMLAEKWRKPVPFIFNLFAECRSAGLPLPDQPDGRENARRDRSPEIWKCLSCNCDLSSKTTTEDGTKQQVVSGRKYCYNCKPLVSRKKSQNLEKPKSSPNNDLQKDETNRT